MEAADNTLTPWDDDFGSSFDQAHETVGGDPTPDAMPQSQHPTDTQLDDLIAELCNPTGDWDPRYDSPDPDGIVNQYPQIEPSLKMDLTSPSSSGGITHTPFSGGFDFTSSPGSYQTPHMSPSSLMESPPQVYFPGSSQFTPDQTNSSPFTREGFAPGAPSMAPNRASRKRPRRVKSSPPGMKASGMRARSWRKINKPEPCPACPMHFPYQSELDKHLIARHPQIAVEQGLSLDRHACGWCLKEYARKDGLMRHLTNKHQRPKIWKRRPQN